MEIVGKILSIIIVTILGAVTAIVYVLEYDNKPKTTQIVMEDDYTVDENRSYITKYREELRDFKPINVPQRNINKDKSPLWEAQPTNELYTTNIYQEANQIANQYLLVDINKEMKYWKRVYKVLIKKEENKESAKQAYIKYKIYQEAARIKSTH